MAEVYCLLNGYLIITIIDKHLTAVSGETIMTDSRIIANTEIECCLKNTSGNRHTHY